jgi:hypothetical protein
MMLVRSSQFRFLYCSLILFGSWLLSNTAVAKDPYTIIFVPDTQYIMRPNGDVPTWTGKITEWVKTERAAYDTDSATGTNIRAVVHLGDICDKAAESVWWGTPTLQEWRSRANQDLTSHGIPFIPVMGNHDLDGVDCETDASCADIYRSYFGGSFLTDQAEFVEATQVSDGTPYGHDTGSVFLVPTGNGSDRLAVITGEWHSGQTMEQIGHAHRNWLGQMLRKYRGYPSLVAMHQNVKSLGGPMGPHTTCRKSAGSPYWHDEFDLHRNLFMVINGHDIEGNLQYDSTIPGDELNHVWSCNQERASAVPGYKYSEVMTNFQLIDSVYGTSGTGDGLLRIVEIDEDAGTMQHTTCSPDTILDYCFPGVRQNFTVTGIDFAARRVEMPPESVPLLTQVGTIALIASIGAVGMGPPGDEPEDGDPNDPSRGPAKAAPRAIVIRARARPSPAEEPRLQIAQVFENILARNAVVGALDELQKRLMKVVVQEFAGEPLVGGRTALFQEMIALVVLDGFEVPVEFPAQAQERLLDDHFCQSPAVRRV